MKKPPVLGPRRGNKSPLSFFNEVKTELKKVRWPTRQEVIKLTSIVLGTSIVMGVVIGGFDILFTKVLEGLLK